ncbi:iron hydrogenase HydA [Gottschalkia acidurici 9a]|uniref:Iron hydrogenase HydA n=1 Tax=Gottschalkia acidurici (strain ATCC 7906 / DSM 604 / BCRC 14475 / CIP 104303 / KCTC 5404 / NCIMB 10678 / 9a) TaxID=1128398 RepID=K0AXR5_GOTA9|nr:NAD(P)H-dependent oxidoreductase subunit E [Gottschalkia acidurici]AFS77577.1 iron hydrogenase HydA [Gottschalkia acidurici 9a]
MRKTSIEIININLKEDVKYVCNESLETKYNELSEYIDNNKSEEDYLSILLKAQDMFGYLPKEVQNYISQKLGASEVEIQRLVKNNRLKERPIGKYDIRVCTGLHCTRKGYSENLEEFKRLLDIKPGEITKDGKFSMYESGCRGGCRKAPVVSVNMDDRYTEVTKDDVKEILNKYK